MALVQQFYRRFHGLPGVRPTAKELAQAATLLTTHGEALAHFLVTYAHEVAIATAYQPATFMGILHYLSRAQAAYAVRMAKAVARRTAAIERTQREQYAQWRQETLTALRAALSDTERTALEVAQQARLRMEGTAASVLPFAVRLTVDEVLETQAGLPDFAAWQPTQSAMSKETRDASL